MKRMIIIAAAVAAAVATTTAPAAQAQECTTPVTTCVEYYGDQAIATVMAEYNWAMQTIQNGPNINSYCKLIWPDGCNMPTP